MHVPTFKLSVLFSLLAATGLGAQSDGPGPTGPSKGVPAGLTVKIVPASEICQAGQPIVLKMSLSVTKECSISTTWLSGMHFTTMVNGKKGPKITKKSSGKVKLVPGTKIERALSIDIKQIVPNLDQKSVTRVSFDWVGAKGVGAVVDIAPSLKGVNVDELDLTQTRVLLVTNYGEMLIKFRPDMAPKTVKNFIKLSKDGYYDGTRFHRIIRGFMIQGGCPNTKKGATGMPGTGNPGYTVDAEFNQMRHVKGVLSMARSSDPNSAGSQFFVVHANAPHLDNKYTAFGELVSGEDTLDKIAGVAVGGPQRSTPVEPVHLKAAVVQPVFKKKKK